VVQANWDKGRAAQKLRTRQALMDTAVELVKAGRRPSVAAVADPQSGYQRPGRRGRWVDEIVAAAGDRLDQPARARLSAALHLVLGIDPIIELTDVAGLDRAEALDVLEWVAATLVRASLASGPDEEAGAGEQAASATTRPRERRGRSGSTPANNSTSGPAS